MAGELVPTVMFPRFTTLSGAGTYTTAPLQVTRYAELRLNVWRGPLIGTTPTILFTIQESIDRENWTTCSGTSAFDPGSETEDQETATLTKRWMRLKAVLAGTDAGVTCWATGGLELRET